MSEFTETTTYSDSTQPLPESSTSSSTSTSLASRALTSLASAIPSTDNIKNKFASAYEQARPWSEFANTSALAAPQMGELKDRVVENYQYYAYNYVVILAALTVFTVLTSPLSILGLLAIFAAYTHLFIMNPEPIEVFGGSLVLDGNSKSAVLLVGGLIVLWLTGAGATFTSLLFTGLVLATLHAAFRKSQSEADFDTAYEPAGV